MSIPSCKTFECWQVKDETCQNCTFFRTQVDVYTYKKRVDNKIIFGNLALGTSLYCVCLYWINDYFRWLLWAYNGTSTVISYIGCHLNLFVVRFPRLVWFLRLVHACLRLQLSAENTSVMSKIGSAVCIVQSNERRSVMSVPIRHSPLAAFPHSALFYCLLPFFGSSAVSGDYLLSFTFRRTCIHYLDN